ncbi:MAG: heat-inducible transcription repressor HrcA [Armatimonadetes bacterium]|nr:heat-inducible transcription repressor HrcA [Armatimonadota bacterium]
MSKSKPTGQGDQLDPRKQMILRAVVFEYVTGAEPVGSELLTQKYELGVRSATVRNELAEMSDLGYLDQPHTSAGRIPSDLGYRYFVDHMIVYRDLGPHAKRQVQTITRDGELLQTLLTETTSLLSRLTRLMSAATTITNQHLRAKSAMLTALGPDRALVVLVLSNGHVENKLVECPEGMTLAHIGRANNELMGLINEKSLTELVSLSSATHHSSDPAYDRLMHNVLHVIQSICRDLTKGKIIVEGEEYLFGQPEFMRDPAPLQQLLQHIEDRGTASLATSKKDEHGLDVKIGKENNLQVWKQFAVIRHPFFVGDQEMGNLTIVGPTRLDYESNIPLLTYAAQAVSDTLTKIFGPGK